MPIEGGTSCIESVNVHQHASTHHFQARNQVTATLRKDFFTGLKDASKDRFWKTINKKPVTVPNLNLLDGSVTSTPKEKADALNLFFASCFNQSYPPLRPDEAPNSCRSTAPVNCYAVRMKSSKCSSPWTQQRLVAQMASLEQCSN